VNGDSPEDRNGRQKTAVNGKIPSIICELQNTPAGETLHWALGVTSGYEKRKTIKCDRQGCL